MGRNIKEPVRCMLWGRSAARCEFRGCNCDLTRHPETKELVNIAEAAHIIGFSEDGPRGEEDLSEELAQDIDNLMLICRICHKTIDTNKESYPVSLLKEIKQEHEERIALASAIDVGRKSHVVMYGAGVGNHDSPLNFARVAPALHHTWYPADPSGILLGMVNSVDRDSDPEYWATQDKQLRHLVENRIKARVQAGEIVHLSIFAIAPQPLLILLGYLLSDLIPAEVYQLHREPPTWQWNSGDEDGLMKCFVERPREVSGPPALVLGTTDRIADGRILSEIPNASIWRVTIDRPHNDFLKVRSQLEHFRGLIRSLIDEIKNNHGMDAPIHVFPATSVAIAVELGRCIQPKITPPMRLYDNISSDSGFAHALDLGTESDGGKS